jgi:metal-responsive CopG/Arc/MetJ family transcriptional regulator
MVVKKASDESKGTVGVSVRLPEGLLAEIDRMAADDRRTRGNMVRLLLEDAVAAKNAESRKK